MQKKRRVNLFLVGYTVILTVLAVVGYIVADYKINPQTHHTSSTPDYFASDLAMYDLPRINVSIPTNNGKTTRVRIDISLEVAKKDMERLEGFKPRITNRIMNYLRTQDLSHMTVPEAVNDLHTTLLEEADGASRPIPIRDVVFRQFLIM